MEKSLLGKCRLRLCPLLFLMLDRFYKAQGFMAVDGFEVKKDDGTVWPGTLLRMDIGENVGDE